MKKFELKPVKGFEISDDSIQFMIETTLETIKSTPGLQGQSFCTMGNTLVHVYQLWNGDIEVEVTERKSRLVIRKVEEAKCS